MRKHSVVISLLLILTLSLSLLLTACGGGVREDVAVGDLLTAVAAKVENSDDLIDPGSGFIAGRMQLDPDALGEHIVRINPTGLNINEFGIFKAASAEEAKALAAQLEEYLARRDEEWMPEYLPEEYPKLENADVHQKGLYVLYMILDTETQEAVVSAFDAALAK